MNGCVTLASDLERFINGFQQTIALVAHMGVVASSVLTRDRRQRCDLLCLRIYGRRVDQGRRYANRTRLHRFADKSLHLLEFIITWSSINITQDNPADLCMPHGLNHIHRKSP